MKTARAVAHEFLTSIKKDCNATPNPSWPHDLACNLVTMGIEADRSARGLDPMTIEAAARACEKSYRTAVGRMDRQTPEAAATAARGWAARCIRALCKLPEGTP